jgi:hypothetical protein
MSSKQTAVISADSPLLRRAINQQSQEKMTTSTLSAK